MAGKPPGKPEDRPIPTPTGYLPSLGTGRKRRNDARPGLKPDYHKGAVLSVRVDGDLAAWVRGQAKAKGISVNSWLRDLLENLRSRG